MKRLAILLFCALLGGCAAPLPSSPAPTPEPTTSPRLLPTASPSVAPVAPTASPSAPVAPSPYSVAPIVCGRIDDAHCQLIQDLVFRQFPFAIHATVIVTDYTCPRGAFCVFGFNAIVSIIVPRDPAADYAYWPPTYSVSGTSGPKTIKPWSGTLPVDFQRLLESAGFSG